MAKKKKRVKTKYTFICEGDREYYLLKYLNVQILDKINKIIHKRGGTAESIVSDALNLSCVYPNLVVVFDQDFQSKGPMSEETLRRLENQWGIADNLDGVDYKDLLLKNVRHRNPVLIVSHPCSIEGFILRVFGRQQDSLNDKSTTQLKGEVVTLMDAVLQNVDTSGDQDGLANLSPDMKKYCLFLIHSNFLQRMRDNRCSIPECDVLLKLFETP